MAWARIATVAEDFHPLAGVGVECFNVDTLAVISVVETDLGGIALFTGLPENQRYFFKVRARRTSTRVQSTLDPDRGRTYTGQIRLQILATSAICFDAVVDPGGEWGSSKTIQGAIDAFANRILVFPGTYNEALSVTDGRTLYIEGCSRVLVKPYRLGAADSQSVVVTARYVAGTPPALTVNYGSANVTVRGVTFKAAAHQKCISLINKSLTLLDCTVYPVDASDTVGVYVEGSASIQAQVELDRVVVCVPSGIAFQSGAPSTAVEYIRINRSSLTGRVLIGGGSVHLLRIIDTEVQSPTVGGVSLQVGTAGTGTIIDSLWFVGNSFFYGGGQANVIMSLATAPGNPPYGVTIIGNHFTDSSAVNVDTGLRIEAVCGAASIIVVGNHFTRLSTPIDINAAATGVIVWANDYVGSGAISGTPTPIGGGELAAIAHNLLSATHPDTLPAAVLDGSLIIGNATPKWSALAISIPAANVRNVLGIDNAELRPSWKTALDATLPVTITAGGTGAAGTSLIFAHRDHDHPAPAAWPPGAHSHAHGDLTGVTADQHHAGFIGLTIAGPANIDPDAGDRITIEDSASVTWASSGAGKIAATAVAGGVDHGGLSGLGDDDHTQYLKLLGRAGGQTTIGGTGSGDDLILQSTSHATRGYVQIVDGAYMQAEAGIGAEPNVFGDAMLTIAPNATTRRGLVIWGIALQTVDYIRVVNSAGALQFTLSPDGANCHLMVNMGDITSGQADARIGIFTAYGDAPGGDSGGILQLEVAADHDAVGFDYWGIQPYEDDLKFFTQNGVVVNVMTYQGQLQLPVTGSGAGILIGGDIQLYRAGAGQLLASDGAGGGIIWVGDTNHGLNFAGGDPIFHLDSNDYWQYTRATNTLSFYIGGAVQFSFVTNLASFPRGGLNVGTDDTLAATLTLYGHGAGTADGAEVRLYLSADHDAVFHYWGVDAYEDDLRFFTSDGATVNVMTAEGQFQLPRTGATAGLVIGADANLYRSAANVLKTDDSFVVAGVLGLSILNQYELRLYDSGSSNYIGHKADAARTTDLVYIWPATDPTAGQVLSSSDPVAGVATLSWAAAGGGIPPSVEDWSGISNATEDRTADMNATSIDELADIVGTLIADLRAVGLLQ